MYQHLLIFKWRDLNAVSKKKSSPLLMKIMTVQKKAKQLTFFSVLCNVVEMSQIQYCWGWLWYNYGDVSTYFFWKMASKLNSNLEYLLYPELLSRDRISCLFLSISYWKQSTQSSGFMYRWHLIVCLDWQAGKFTSYCYTLRTPNAYKRKRNIIRERSIAVVKYTVQWILWNIVCTLIVGYKYPLII